MSLYQTLTDLRIKYAKILKPGLAAIIDAHMEHLRAEGSMDRILKAGSHAPEFDLLDGLGKSVSSRALLERGPLIISFYRGSWCPYCVEELRELNRSYDAIRAAGADLVVISPQAFEHTKKQQDELGLRFSILVDKDNEVARKFGLAYKLPEDLKSLYLNTFKNDLEKHNGPNGKWELPVPARFVIDQRGVIQDVKADPDYRFRPEPEDSVAVVRNLKR